MLVHLNTLFDVCKPRTFEDFVSEPLYYNFKIQRDKKTIFLRDWFISGIVSVGHLLGPHGFLALNEFRKKISIAECKLFVLSRCFECG